MRGYFAIGIEGVSKYGNMGNLIRTAHGFGAAFAFSIRPEVEESEIRKIESDTSKSENSIPFFEYDTLDEMKLPKGCQNVGVEITDDATELPSFRHPMKATYILGSERLSLSPAILERCDHVIQIPTRFSLNVATAGAIIMYDRLISMGKFADRPVSASGSPIPKPPHVRGGPRLRSKTRTKTD